MTTFYEDVLEALERSQIKYVIVGGVAVILHGVPRTTADLDVVVDLDRSNVLKLVEVLELLGFRPRAPVPAKDLADPHHREAWRSEKGMKAFSFWRPQRPLDAVDVLFDSPLDFGQLRRNAEEIQAGPLKLHIASLADLITMKQNTGRAQDSSDVDAMKRLRDALKETK